MSEVAEREGASRGGVQLRRAERGIAADGGGETQRGLQRSIEDQSLECGGPGAQAITPDVQVVVQHHIDDVLDADRNRAGREELPGNRARRCGLLRISP